MELKDIISGFINFVCILFFVASTVKNIYNSVRALLIAKEAGLLKVMMVWDPMIEGAVLLVAAVVLWVTVFSKAGESSFVGIYLLLGGIWMFSAGFVPIVYVTKEGLMTGRRDDPAPISAEYSDGVINIYHRGRINESGMVGSVEATPKNMAAFKRFFVLSGLEQADTPPDNNNMVT